MNNMRYRNMDNYQLKYKQLKTRLTVLLILGILSLFCWNVFSVVTVPCALIGLNLLDCRDWEKRHRDEIQRLSQRIMNLKRNPPLYNPMSYSDYLKFHSKYLNSRRQDLEMTDEEWSDFVDREWSDYIERERKSYDKALKEHEKEIETLGRHLDNLRAECVTESVLSDYYRAKRLANIALAFLVIHLILLVVITVFDRHGSLTNLLLDMF